MQPSRISRAMSNASEIRREENSIFEMPETERREFKKISHEMGVGNNNVRMMA